MLEMTKFRKESSQQIRSNNVRTHKKPLFAACFYLLRKCFAKKLIYNIEATQLIDIK